MRTLPVARGTAVVLVDDEDFELVSPYTWRLVQGGGGQRYASAWVGVKDVFMHRLITGAARGKVVDHIDGNPLNNQRANLRVCTQAENQGNRRKIKPASSIYKGVSWVQKRRKWQASLYVSGRQRLLGRFASEIEAARAYDAAAKQHFGEFALLNQA
jgi:hypothetical protein